MSARHHKIIFFSDDSSIKCKRPEDGKDMRQV